MILSILALTAALAANVPSAAVAEKPRPAQPVVRISVINMSGKDREAHLRTGTLALPLARPVALRLPAGTPITITSPTDRHIRRTLLVTAADEGRLYPIP